MTERKYDVRAFKALLRVHAEHGGKTWNSTLFQIGENTGLVVRRMNYTDVPDQKQIFGNASLEKSAGIIKAAYKELNERYGIPSAVHFVISKDEEGEPALFALAENILETKDPVAEADAAYDLYEKLLVYYEEKLESGWIYLEDIGHTGQYVFGKRLGDLANRFYLVDVDGYLAIAGSAASNRELKESAFFISFDEKKYGHMKDFSPLKIRAEKLRAKLDTKLGNI